MKTNKTQQLKKGVRRVKGIITFFLEPGLSRKLAKDILGNDRSIAKDFSVICREPILIVFIYLINTRLLNRLWLYFS